MQQSDWVSLSGKTAGVFTEFPLNSTGREVDGRMERETERGEGWEWDRKEARTLT